MSKAQHTPGQWINGGRYIGGSKGYNVASVNSHATTEGRANARLISAAPELLEALEKALQPLELYHAYGWPDMGGVRETIKAAIAKAKGE